METQNYEEKQYLDIVKKILEEGDDRDDRTGIGTLSLFSTSMKFDLSKSFPLLTTKKTFLRGVFEELKWFISGSTDSKILEAKGINIWKGNTSREALDKLGLNHYDEGEVGPSYG